ncbi:MULTISPECIES: 30S ribosomal protein S1 [Halomonadaceae]|jgi:small subunit ribosomal protein S1|uniref:30S ribosomal protein S1 n=4 Tax=Vreelandella TaxID=3137766 RepID=A0A558J6G0_9GAMM|nr:MULTISPECIES: 30S ribosomal protein S1 [Halomonas]MBT2774396.1 30S ribosomal protein S1 [Halomonas sp. ISL-60]NAO96958.1 30S ribosomal protein S1 [Halomonas sp. MG34]QGQ70416.1 30S ribosomal protein S1 [Halomonas sp. PA16-9]TDV95806.1 SSU ribosomal protein S1P [Halomonas alkaliantarctica]UEQ06234.1 30S ribosomal protein S1 [Halomonas profundus]|tara:strand:+ start:9682 stop:11361 length:1680 start_codon:yes stop_codon:yes gene_type:complete|eukprot:TRINITY_DN8661_c0_g5_i1.p1 TRINITY_DN8661_c0_g5~~TRINITY_DN8661_c0_g5_i1.p1  ORF type:complete len:560 (+),score=79.07 TRINITY_DN8661_c0_g5_i1:402-2081(+)
MSESFAELFEQSLNDINMEPGAIVAAQVVDIDGDWVTVNAGLKSEGQIPASQFRDEHGNLNIAIGDDVHVALEAVEDGFGETRLSREKAKRAEAWKILEAAFEKDEIIKGVINGKVKGGFTVEVDSIRAFLPGSLVDVRPVRDTAHLENKELDFKVIKLDPKRNNVVVSRRAVLEAENSAEREALLATLQEGQQIKGIVKNLTDYGAFVDLGGVDGLLHITDMAWKRIKHPSEIVAVGDEINVKVLKFDRERNRVSLGLKQLGEDPWVNIKERYPEGMKVHAVVTNLTDYGCFAELEEGVEGLVHVSEMDWTNKNIHPSKVVQVGDDVDVMVLDIDEERRRISLGIKQCTANPWETFNTDYNKGDRVSGTIKSITDFGIFIGLEGGIDGLVHLSDISWTDTGEEAVRSFKKGDEAEAVILSIDPERERISLGIKQMDSDPVAEYLSVNDKGSIVTGRVIEVDAKEAQVELATDVIAVLKASEISADRVEDARNVLNEGDSVEARIVSVDRKSRQINLSVKAKDQDDTRQNLKKMREQEPETAGGPTTIGDLIKQQMGQD